jgi:formylglycine-generating enzyme required for sulfatase activity
MAMATTNFRSSATQAACAVCLALFLCLSAKAVDWPNPPDPLRLPAPDNAAVDFIPVFIGADSDLIGTVEFVAGTAGKTPEETPTLTTVGGSFSAAQDGRKDWFYYISTKEVTMGVYNSVMKAAGLPASDAAVPAEMPVTGISWFQVQEFLRAYNRWLMENTNLLPTGEDRVVAFVRLPTEAEWEFAARGGTKVSRDVFDQKTPYGEAPLEEYEWFGGPSSSHNKLQLAGVLKPNPLGLHDMLGNAAEMTGTPFQLEPGQGPVGAMVRRGGNYRTPMADLRSSLRGEFLPYSSEGKEAGFPDLGFRLVISGIVFSDISRVEEIKRNWEEYCATRIVPAPGTRRAQPTSTSLQKAKSEVDEIAASRNRETSADQLAEVQAKAADMTAQKFRSDKRSAQALVRLCSLSSFRIASNSALLKEALGGDLVSGINDMTKKVLDDHTVEPEVYVLIGNLMKMVTMFPEYKRETADNDLKNMLQVYGESLELLADIDPQVVEGAFAEQISSLNSSEILYAEQIATTETARQHYRTFARERKFSPDAWAQELLDSLK